jgi:hypothetical protein
MDFSLSGILAPQSASQPYALALTAMMILTGPLSAYEYSSASDTQT